MSKAAKKSVFILMALLIAAVVFAYYTHTELIDAESDLVDIERQLDDAQNQLMLNDEKHAKAVKVFQDSLKKVDGEKTDLLTKIDGIEEEAKEQADTLAKEINSITDDRDKWKRRIETIREERDQLMAKIGDLNEKLEDSSKRILASRNTAEGGKDVVKKEPVIPPSLSRAPSILPDTGRVVDEQYWANLLQEKASLEIDILKLKEDLTAKSISLVEIKQENEDLVMEIATLKSEKEAIVDKVQHTSDMIDNISLELARTKNDKKFIVNRAEKLSEDNKELRSKLKKLVSVKNALEKSIVRVTQEKEKVEGKLGRTETLIQSKIDEIWDIKDELDHSIRASKDGITTSEIELPPIVVSSSGAVESFNTGESSASFNGSVISINESNNFVIVDIGENSGIRLGDNLSVYRESKYIARLEVIQVREDISAADLKDQWSKIKVGDVIR